MVSEEITAVQEQKKATRAPEISSEVKYLLSIRKSLKARKPAFRRQESWRYKRVHPSWRRPKGIDSKMRLKLGGRPKSVEVGYRSPKEVRGLNGTGHPEKLVSNVSELNEVNAGEVVRVSGTVGQRKRIAILEKARSLNLHVVNPRRVREAES
jgi:large subunit ribosomal protein L32e